MRIPISAIVATSGSSLLNSNSSVFLCSVVKMVTCSTATPLPPSLPCSLVYAANPRVQPQPSKLELSSLCPDANAQSHHAEGEEDSQSLQSSAGHTLGLAHARPEQANP